MTLPSHRPWRHRDRRPQRRRCRRRMVYRSRPISRFGWRSPWSLRSPAGIAPRHVYHQAKGFARLPCSGRRPNILSKSSMPRVVLPSLLQMVTLAFPPSTACSRVSRFMPERPEVGGCGRAGMSRDGGKRPGSFGSQNSDSCHWLGSAVSGDDIFGRAYW